MASPESAPGRSARNDRRGALELVILPASSESVVRLSTGSPAWSSPRPRPRGFPARAMHRVAGSSKPGRTETGRVHNPVADRDGRDGHGLAGGAKPRAI